MGYSTRADSENVYGPTNIAKWADVENHEDKAHIAERVAWAIDEAQVEIDGELRGGPYDVPFTTVPAEIRSVSARLVGVLLYESRSITDTEGAESKYIATQRKRVKTTLRRILAGQLQLAAVPVTASYPRVIDDDDD